MRDFLAVAVAVFALIGLTGHARAEAGCAAASDTGDIADTACTTVLSFTTVVGGEPVAVTVVADRALPSAEAQASQVRTAVERSAARLSALGLSGFPDVTIALAAALADEPEATDGATGMSGADCAIGLAAPALTDAGLLRHTTAHELFHCAQFLLQPGLTDLVASAWWSEGSAEWFANWVFPGTAYSSSWVADFDAASVDTPVTAMDYPAVVFFAWYGQAHGPAGIAGFIRGLTGSADDLAAAVGEDGWWQFAEAYFDGTIRWPGGGALPSAPQRGPSITFTDTRDAVLEADRYVLYRADVVFEAGYWTLTNDLDAGRYDVGEGGEQLPDAIETGCDEPTRFRLRGSGIGTDGYRLAIEATLEEEAACEGCIEAAELDRCLVGAWAYSAGGPGDWLRSVAGSGVTITIPSDGNPGMVFYRDGTYRATLSGLQGIVTVDDARGEIVAGMVGAGRWSTSGTTLHICEDSLAGAGTVTIEGPGMSATMPVPFMPGTTLAMDYACTADMLITELRFPGIPQPMVTNYARATPPPGP